MAAASDVTRLLDDIEARQQQVIEELDALIVRIEGVIAEWTEPGKKKPEAAAATPPSDTPAIAGEIVPAAVAEPDSASEPAAEHEPAAASEPATETKAA